MEELANAVDPSNVVLLIGFIGIVLFAVRRLRPVAPLVLSLAPILLLTLSSGKTATALSSPPEYAYCEVDPPRADSPVRTIVVLGVPEAQIRGDRHAAHTADSADSVQALLGESSFLVTSAGPTPRSMGVVVKQGLTPIAAPTEHHVPKYLTQANWSPSSMNLYITDLAMHEYGGL